MPNGSTGAGARLLAHPPIAIIGLDGQADGRILIMIVGPEPETCADCAVQKRLPSSTVGQSRSQAFSKFGMRRARSCGRSEINRASVLLPHVQYVE